MNRQIAMIAAGLALSTSAAAQSQIVFNTSDTRNNTAPGTQDFIGLIDTAAPGSFSTLFTNGDADSRLKRIINIGGDSFLVGDSPFPSSTNTGSIFRFDGLLGGAPVQSTVLGGGGFLLDPEGIAYNASSNYFVFNNNPAGTGTNPNATDGVYVANLDGSGLTQVFQENAADPFPRFQAGTELRQSRSNENVFWAVSLNGGTDGASDSFRSSAITRIDVDANNFSNSTVSTTIGLDMATTGLDRDLNFVQGFTEDNDGNLYFANAQNASIYKAVLNANGDGFDSVELLANVGDESETAGLRRGGVGDLEYDPFRNKLVFAQVVISAALLPGEQQGIGYISEIDLDGTGYNLIQDGIYINDLTIIPAPASAALLGLGGLAAVRRRR